MKLSMKLLTVLIVGVCQSLAAPKAELDTCHTEDYIKCALVIAGCSSTCTGSSVRIWKLIFAKNKNCNFFREMGMQIIFDRCHFVFIFVSCLFTFQDWMNCMIDCVINQHHEECIDCISRVNLSKERPEVYESCDAPGCTDCCCDTHPPCFCCGKD